MNLHIDAAEFAPLIDAAVDAAIRRMESQRPRDATGRVLLSKREASAVLGLSEATLDRLRKSDLPAVKLDGKVLFRPAALEAWAQQREGGLGHPEADA
ncbi:MAG: helix-turn-helix domain-containing protein [Thermoguttaceae bacterium]